MFFISDFDFKFLQRYNELLFICHLPDYENYLTNEVKYFLMNSYKDFCKNACALMAKLNQGLSV